MFKNLTSTKMNQFVNRSHAKSIVIFVLTMLLTACISILIFRLINSVQADEEPIVKLPNGRLIGTRLNIFNKPLYSYLGIPYSLPANEIRFKPPLFDDRTWGEDRIAQSYSPGCPVPEKYIKFQNLAQTGYIKYSEDCLYLNIWSPVYFNRTNPLDNNQLKPVVIFIHGGALLFNSASEDKYFDGRYLASLGDIVVVTFNYRLGILGFLYDGKEIKGNLGLLDQRLAFEWVAKNIKQFGGDPNKITISGESAGSWSVGIHLLLEKENRERALFHHAIMMSGSPLQPVLGESEDVALRKFALVQKKTKCANLECLQKTPLKELMQLSDDDEIIKMSKNVYRLAFQPVYGLNNGFLSKSTLDLLLDKGHEIRNISLLIGNLVNEGIDVWTLWKLSFQNLKIKEPKSSKDEYIDALRLFVNTTISLEHNDLESLVANMDKFYFNAEVLDSLKGDEEMFESFQFSLQSSFYELLSDLVFICPSKYYAEKYFQKTQNENVFEYQITYESMSAGSKNFAPWCEQAKFGPCHMLDLQYLFGRPFKSKLIAKYSQQDRAMSFDLIKTVANFAKTGKTNWKSYFKMQVKDEHLIVPTEFEFNPNAGNEELIGFQYLSCHMFNKYFYPKQK